MFRKHLSILQILKAMNLKAILTFALCFSLAQIGAAQSVKWYDAIGRLPNEWNSYTSSYHRHGTLVADDRYLYLPVSYQGYTDSTLFCKSGTTFRTDNRRTISFIAQYTHDGTLRWVKAMSSAYNGYTNGTENETQLVTKNRAIYSLSYGSPGQVFGKDTIESGVYFYQSVVFSKLDENGNILWNKIAQPNSSTSAYDIVCKKLLIDDAENIYAVFQSRGVRPLVFDSLRVRNGERFFVYKFDKNGNVLFAQPLELEKYVGNLDFLQIRDAKLDKKGNLFVLAGQGSSNVSSSCRYSDWDALVVRMSSDGKKQAKYFQATSDDLMSCKSFQVLDNGDLIIVGANRGQIRFTNGTVFGGNCSEMGQFMMRVTPKSEKIWFRTILNGYRSGADDISAQADDGTFLVSGNSEHRDSKPYPNYPQANSGRNRFFIKRINSTGQVIDSVAFYSNFEKQLAWGNVNTVQVNGKTFAAFDYSPYYVRSGQGRDDYMDSLRICSLLDGQAIFIAQLSDNVLQKPLPVSMPLSNFTIFPNPSYDGQAVLRFAKDWTDAKTIRIYNLQGVLVYQTDIPAEVSETYLQLQSLSAGMYLVQAIMNNETAVTKFQKL